jgi:hypothetical protein
MFWFLAMIVAGSIVFLFLLSIMLIVVFGRPHDPYPFINKRIVFDPVKTLFHLSVDEFLVH